MPRLRQLIKELRGVKVEILEKLEEIRCGIIDIENNQKDLYSKPTLIDTESICPSCRETVNRETVKPLRYYQCRRCGRVFRKHI